MVEVISWSIIVFAWWITIGMLGSSLGPKRIPLHIYTCECREALRWRSMPTIAPIVAGALAGPLVLAYRLWLWRHTWVEPPPIATFQTVTMAVQAAVRALSLTLGSSVSPHLTMPELEEKQELRVGWRSWDYNPLQSKHVGKLMGHYGQTWSDATFKATCPYPGGDVALHIANNDCECGVYSYKKLEAVTGLIVGRVVNWGYMLNGVHGYRSQFTRIEELYISRDVHIASNHLDSATLSPSLAVVAAELREHYGVPVSIVTNEELRKIGASYGSDRASSTGADRDADSRTYFRTLLFADSDTADSTIT